MLPEDWKDWLEVLQWLGRAWRVVKPLFRTDAPGIVPCQPVLVRQEDGIDHFVHLKDDGSIQSYEIPRRIH